MKKNSLAVSGLTSVLCTLFLIAGCDGDEGEDAGIGVGLGTAKDPSSQFVGSIVTDGQLIDSPVQGVSFVAGNQAGTTDAQGTFRSESGANVRFFIGDIGFGETLARSIVTPVELVRGATDETHPFVTNIARFLQTLDNDAEPSNGITIIAAVQTAAVGRSINFEQSVPEFGADGNVQTVVAELTALTTAGSRSLISTRAARDHLRETLLETLSGTYAGAFIGDYTGSFTFLANPQGSVNGSGRSDQLGFLNLGGIVKSDGSLSLAAGNSLTGVAFVGDVLRSGELFGVWQDQFTGAVGTFSGSREGSEAQGTGSGRDVGFRF